MAEQKETKIGCRGAGDCAIRPRVTNWIAGEMKTDKSKEEAKSAK